MRRWPRAGWCGSGSGLTVLCPRGMSRRSCEQVLLATNGVVGGFSGIISGHLDFLSVAFHFMRRFPIEIVTPEVVPAELIPGVAGRRVGEPSSRDQTEGLAAGLWAAGSQRRRGQGSGQGAWPGAVACSVVCSFTSERVWPGGKVLHSNKSGPARRSPLGRLDVGFGHTASRCRCQEVRAPLGAHIQGGEQLGTRRTRAGGAAHAHLPAAHPTGAAGAGPGRGGPKGFVTRGGAGADLRVASPGAGLARGE
ncbi:uncharacterized protein LOC123934053 [Meles meles]|uniref:uncharacterized protein LOC123934053 n=1 Tax=Meles meles TaxID=9662 RepID=UPI001E6A01F2|nr:uncharacterized protein LOC123934053 [Meles meles]